MNNDGLTPIVEQRDDIPVFVSFDGGVDYCQGVAERLRGDCHGLRLHHHIEESVVGGSEWPETCREKTGSYRNIRAHAYGVPARWCVLAVQYSEVDGESFWGYFATVGLRLQDPLLLAPGSVITRELMRQIPPLRTAPVPDPAFREVRRLSFEKEVA